MILFQIVTTNLYKINVLILQNLLPKGLLAEANLDKGLKYEKEHFIYLNNCTPKVRALYYVHVKI